MRDARTAIVAALLLFAIPLAGCIGDAPSTGGATTTDVPSNTTDGNRSRFADPDATGPAPPEDENYTGLQPIDMVFGGSLRHPLTRVALVPPTHGDLGDPANGSRSGLAYLRATLEGIFSWEVAIDRFVEQYPEYGYLDNVTIQVELLEGEVPETAGYDIIIGYAETSGPLFRGVAFGGFYDTQRHLDEAGVGEQVHYGNRYILLSLFASAPRAGQQVPDYPETHEVRGVTMHEFAHTFGLGHSTTWTRPYGPDLMNSPYPFVYGDGSPVGDGGERSEPLCISTLDLYGLAHLYRWLPNGSANWEGSSGQVSLPADVLYEPYCVEAEAGVLADRWLADRGLAAPLGRAG